MRPDSPSSQQEMFMRTAELPISHIQRLLEIADRAGVKQGVDIVGPHDTVIVEEVRAALSKAHHTGG
jgi:hypothetical protein